ncbi:MAG TPA: ankyrin repeat domain-containing protein, partial [Spirochaetia bacterium]
MRKCSPFLVLATVLLLCGSDASPTHEEALLFSTEPSKMADAYAELLASGFDPDLRDADGFTLLFTAAFKDRIDVAAWLLEHGADVNALDNWKNTVLHHVADPLDSSMSDTVAWARLLVKHGIDVNARNTEGLTALADAAENGDQLEFIAYLVSQGADVNLGDNEGIAPLGHASQYGLTKNAAFLKSKGARPYSDQFPVDNAAPACAAVLSGDPARIARIPEADLRAMVGRTSFGVPATPLHLAAERAPVNLVAALCARRVDWNVGDRYGRTPLALAVLGGRAD